MRFRFKRFMIVASLLLLLFVGWFAWQLFGPSPKVIVSRQTTYLTEPLAADGLPNYGEAIRLRQREGVTPENNGAVPFWRAMWPGPSFSPIDDGDRDLFATELGIDPDLLDATQRIVSPDDEPTTSKIVEWLKTDRPPDEPATDDEYLSPNAPFESPLHEQAFEIAHYALSSPWKSDAIPPVADWVRENQQGIDLLLEAARLPKWYSPSIALLNGERWAISNGFGMDMANIGAFRDAARALSCRAMWHLGEDRPAEAWQDIRAMQGLAQRSSEGQLLVTELVAIAVSGISLEATKHLLDYESLSPELAQQVLHDLRAIPAFDGVGRSANGGERFFVLEPLLALSQNDTSALLDAKSFQEPWVVPALKHSNVNFNSMLASMNEAFDTLAVAAKHPSALQRHDAIRIAKNRIHELSQQPGAGDFVAGLVSRGARSQVLAGRIIDNFFPAFTAALDAQDRTNTTLDLTRLAAALAVYHTDHGAYPESLNALIPGVIDKLPADVFQEKPFMYKRTNNGYLLYSCGENGKDDGGSNQMTSIYRGYEVEPESVASVRQLLGDEMPPITEPAASDELDEPDPAIDALLNHIPKDADDIAIRLPLPKLELPKRVEPKE